MTEKEISTKRRATMNSRRTDEEDEMLRRAIEESKGEAGTLGKRPRDDSEEYDSLIDTTTSRPTDYSSSNKHGSKRQRTLSSSPSTLSKQSRSPSQPPGEEVSIKLSTNGSTGGKKIRGGGATARNHRDKEVRDRQKEIAAQRAEAARKREARSERRRGEGKTAYDHTSKTHFDILQTLHHPHRKSHPPSLFSLLGLLRSRTRRILPLLKDRTQATTAKRADLQLAVVD
jgi:hypothetical protein